MRCLLATFLLFGLTPLAWAHDAWTVQENLAYAERESGPLHGDLYLPAARQRPPVIVMLHGGGWTGGERQDMQRFAREAAEQGYAVFNISYRLAPEHRFPSAIIDARDAVRWLRENASRLDVDASRIAAWGYSAGAHLALLLGLLPDEPLPGEPASTTSPRVQAVVDGAGPTNLSAYPDNKYVREFMPPDADETLYRLASPVLLASSDDAPVFMYHGKRDLVCLYSNSTNLAAALAEAGVAHELVTLSWGHAMSFFFDDRAMRAAYAFLERHLRP